MKNSIKFKLEKEHFHDISQRNFQEGHSWPQQWLFPPSLQAQLLESCCLPKPLGWNDQCQGSQNFFRTRVGSPLCTNCPRGHHLEAVLLLEDCWTSCCKYSLRMMTPFWVKKWHLGQGGITLRPNTAVTKEFVDFHKKQTFIDLITNSFYKCFFFEGFSKWNTFNLQ